MPPPSSLARVGAVVARLLEDVRRPVAVVTDLDLEIPTVADGPAFEVHPVRATLPADTFRTVVLVTADVATLRTDVSRLGNLRWARMVAVVVAESATVLTVRPHPSWPGIAGIDARLDGTCAVTRLDFAARLEVAPVLLALARTAAAPVRTGPGGLRVAGDVVPPADPTYAASCGADDKLPADVLVTADRTAETATATSPVLGRAPVVVHSDDVGRPLDEAVYNPIGFRREWSRGMVDLPADTRLTPALVADLRDAQGVRVDVGADPLLLAGLAMSGVPLEQVDDPDERERRSVRARRAALLQHSTTAWRARLAERAGVAYDVFPDEVAISTDDPAEVTDLLLARRYSGADLVVLPDDDLAGTECFVTTPPAGVVVHDRGRTPAEIVAAGGLVYVTHARSAL